VRITVAMGKSLFELPLSFVGVGDVGTTGPSEHAGFFCYYL
jgi:hypothetical protein